MSSFETAKELAEEGASQRQIAAALGVNQKTVSNDLSEENSSPRPKHHRNMIYRTRND